MIKNILFFILFISIALYAQDFNGDFEIWVDDFTPQGWTTNNSEGTWTTVSRTTESFSGSYAAKLEIGSNSGFPVSSAMASTFTVTQRNEALNGFYKLQQTASNDLNLRIDIITYDEMGSNGWAYKDLKEATAEYTPFTIEIDYFNDSIPDSIFIQMQLISSSFDSSIIGTTALVDELNFGVATNVNEGEQIPNNFSLEQNYPNPFNPTTTISYSIPEVEQFAKLSNVTLKVYDVLGREVTTLINEIMPPGNYEVNFNAAELSSGMYFYKLKAGSFLQTKKMNLIK